MEPLKTVSITPTDSTHFRAIDSIKSVAAEIEQRKEAVQTIIKPQPQPAASKQEPQLQPQPIISQADVKILKLTHGSEPHYIEPDSEPQTQGSKSETHVNHTEGQTCRLDQHTPQTEQYTSKSNSSGSNPDFTGLMDGGQLPVCAPQSAAACLQGDKPDTCKRKGKIGYNNTHTHTPNNRVQKSNVL